MSAEENKAVIRQFIEQVFNQRNVDAVDTYMTADYVDHVIPAGIPPTREGFKQFIGMFLAAFPDFHYTIEDEVAEGDKVVSRLSARGTQQGELLGMPATGKHASWSEIHIGRLAGGQLVEHWGSIDQLGMLQQLGVIPMPGEAGS
jgi:predicted ester cyclase